MSENLAPPEDEPDAIAQKPRRSYGTIAAVIAAVAILGFVAVMMTRGQSDEPVGEQSSPSAVVKVGPEIVSVQRLTQVPAQVGHPIYWIPDMTDVNLELTTLQDSSVYVRYLPKGEKAGVDKGALTVATYANPQAYSLVQSGGERAGAVLVQDSGGALVTAESEAAQNAYFAFEGVPLLVEVFDPEPGRALELIQQGKVQILQE